MNILKSLVVILMLFSNLYAQEVWKITSLDWQPYSGSELTTEGNSIQRLRELLRKENIKLLVEFYPWLRSQAIARYEFGYLGYFPAWPEEVAEGFIASLPVYWSEVGIIRNTETEIIYNDIYDIFENYRVGVIKTYTYPELVEKAMEKHPENVYKIQNETGLLHFLSSGRADVAITDPSVMLFLASKVGIINIEIVEVLMRKELVVAVRDNPDNREKLIILNRLLKNGN